MTQENQTSEPAVKTEAPTKDTKQSSDTTTTTTALKSKKPKKSYAVRIGDSTLSINANSAKTAGSAGVRHMIRSLPVKTDVPVYVKSKRAYHRYTAHRPYDSSKRRSFKFAKNGDRIAHKKITDADGIPVF